MIIQWTDDLSVGVLMIDDQHKSLINQLNALMDAMWDGKGKDQTDKLMAFLANYVVEHFGAEENLMLANNFPKYAQHKQIHETFIRDFSEFKSKHDSGEATLAFSIKVLDDTCEWLRQHIRVMDKELGSFLREQGS
jgi:hemerythrin